MAIKKSCFVATDKNSTADFIAYLKESGEEVHEIDCYTEEFTKRQIENGSIIACIVGQSKNSKILLDENLGNIMLILDGFDVQGKNYQSCQIYVIANFDYNSQVPPEQVKAVVSLIAQEHGWRREFLAKFQNLALFSNDSYIEGKAGSRWD